MLELAACLQCSCIVCQVRTGVKKINCETKLFEEKYGGACRPSQGDNRIVRMTVGREKRKYSGGGGFAVPVPLCSP
jgi:hypothetical protein